MSVRKYQNNTRLHTHTPGPNIGRTPRRSHPDRDAHKQASQKGGHHERPADRTAPSPPAQPVRHRDRLRKPAHRPPV